MFAADKNVFYRQVNVTYRQVANNSTFLWTSIDQSHNYALFASSLWKYSSNLNLFVNYYTLPINTTFKSGTKVLSSSQKVIFTYSNSTYL